MNKTYKINRSIVVEVDAENIDDAIKVVDSVFSPVDGDMSTHVTLEQLRSSLHKPEMGESPLKDMAPLISKIVSERETYKKDTEDLMRTMSYMRSEVNEYLNQIKELKSQVKRLKNSGPRTQEVKERLPIICDGLIYHTIDEILEAESVSGRPSIAHDAILVNLYTAVNTFSIAKNIIAAIEKDFDGMTESSLIMDGYSLSEKIGEWLESGGSQNKVYVEGSSFYMDEFWREHEDGKH